MNSLKRKMSKSEESGEYEASGDHETGALVISELRKPILIREPSFTLAVMGFPSSISMNDFETFFEKYGKINQIVLTRSTVDSQPICFLEFNSQEIVESILQAPPTLNGIQFLLKKYTSYIDAGSTKQNPTESLNSRKKVCLDEALKTVNGSEDSSSSASLITINCAPEKQSDQSKSVKNQVTSPVGKKQSSGDLLLKSISQPYKDPENKPSSSGATEFSSVWAHGQFLRLKHWKSYSFNDHLYDDEIINYVSQLQSSFSLQQNMYTECFYAVEKSLARLNVEFNCYMFGSSFTGLCRQGSDLDIYVQWGSWEKNQAAFLKNCKRVLLQSYEFDRVFIIKARTSLVKCHHKRTDVEVDISFKSRLGVYNSVLIKILLAFDPRLKPMIVFLKYWASNNSLLGSNKINSYCLSWMIIFLLQEMRVLPSIEFLNQFVGTRSFYLGWDVSFFNLSVPTINVCKELFLRENPPKDFSIRLLLFQFFYFYSSFDYSKNVICPINAKLIPRVDIEQLTNLPSCMDKLKQIPGSDRENMFHRSKLFCLQDPIELTFNVGKCVTTKLKDHFLLCCKDAISALSSDNSTFMNSFLKAKPFKFSDSSKSKERTPTKSENKLSTLDEILKAFHSKKSSCFTYQLQSNVTKTDEKNSFNKDRWTFDVYLAFLYFLSELCQLEISVTDKASCNDEVLNTVYSNSIEKLDLNRCQIFYCSGYSFLYFNRKKYKNLVPKGLSLLESEALKNSLILKKELSVRSQEQLENHKLRFIFLFNPCLEKNTVLFTILRYYDKDNQPSKENYSHIFNFLSPSFLMLMNMCLKHVKQNKLNINLSERVKAFALKYRDKLSLSEVSANEEVLEKCTQPTQSTQPTQPTQSTQPTQPTQPAQPSQPTQPTLPPKEGVEKVVSNPSSEIIIIDDHKGEKDKIIKSELAPNDNKPSDQSSVHDSDVEFVECPPKLIECIDVE